MPCVKHQAQFDHHHIPAELTTLHKPGNVCLDTGLEQLWNSPPDDVNPGADQEKVPDNHMDQEIIRCWKDSC